MKAPRHRTARGPVHKHERILIGACQSDQPGSLEFYTVEISENIFKKVDEKFPPLTLWIEYHRFSKLSPPQKV